MSRAHSAMFWTAMLATAADVPAAPCNVDYGVTLLGMVGFSEDRQHGDAGMAATMVTVVNRLRDPRYPKTIYDVVHQPGQYQGLLNWKTPRHPERIDAQAWADAQRLASQILAGDLSAVPRACREATSFDSSPSRKQAHVVCQIGAHKFSVGNPLQAQR